MTSHRDASFQRGDDDIVEISFHDFRPRSSTITSSSSSCTMRAESPENEVVPRMERLIVQPSAVSQESPLANPKAVATKIRFHNEPLEEARRRSHPHHRVDKEGSGISQDPNIIPTIDLVEYEPIFRRTDEKEVEITDVDALEVKLEEEIFQERSARRGRQSANLKEHRNRPVVLPLIELDSYKWNYAFLRVGGTVELRDGSFLKIKALVQDVQTDDVTLRGWKLKRTTRLEEHNGVALRNTNELIFLFEVDLDDARPYLEQSVVEVALNETLRIRRLICTNYPFPKFRFDEDLLHNHNKSPEAQMKYIKDTQVLVARYKLTAIFTNANTRLENVRKPNNATRTQLESLRVEECTNGCAMPALLQRELWRDKTVLGGSGTKSVVIPERKAFQPRNSGKQRPYTISLLDDNEIGVSDTESSKEKLANKFDKTTRKSVQIYTYGDTFTGGGGAMSGALQANLKALFGFDFNPICCATLRANFPDVKVYETWANEFAVMRGEFYVDVLHVSPPCQVFSPVHTRPGKDDEMNFASLFAVLELIKKTRPRMITLEQTFGILHDRFRPAFNTLIKMFIDAGYSVSWQIVKFADFGLAQSRKRLIIVAAGPGETLPEFPAYTHSKHGGNGLKPWNSVRDVLSTIPRNAIQHDVRAAAYNPLSNWHAWDDSSIVTCITTNGGDYNCHPSGRRSLTYRELAALQGFPNDHFFTGATAGAIKRQIGNAVPPVVAKILFESIRKHLEKSDAAEKLRGGP